MKKSKSSSSSKRKERSRSPEDSRSKRSKHRSKSREKDKIKKEKLPRKTRWQAADDKDASVVAPAPDPASQREKSGPPPRIRDFLHDKEKIVDLLFQTVTGAALQELIPDYLKNRSEEELKKLCLGQIKNMTNEDILQIISQKVDSSNKDEGKSVEKEQILKPEQPSPSPEKEEKKVLGSDKKDEVLDEELPNDESESSKTGNTEGENALDEENLIPLVIKDEVAKDLIEPERDAELLELEMRARAIRSLLKSKAQFMNE